MATLWTKHQRRMDIYNMTYWRVSHDAINAHTLFFFEIVQPGECEFAVKHMACLIHTCDRSHQNTRLEAHCARHSQSIYYWAMNTDRAA